MSSLSAENKKYVFLLVSSYLVDFRDLCSLRAALVKDRMESCLTYAFNKLLKDIIRGDKSVVLTLRLDSRYTDEMKYFKTLVQTQLKQLVDTPTVIHNPHIANSSSNIDLAGRPAATIQLSECNPFTTLITALQSCMEETVMQPYLRSVTDKLSVAVPRVRDHHYRRHSYYDYYEHYDHYAYSDSDESDEDYVQANDAQKAAARNSILPRWQRALTDTIDVLRNGKGHYHTILAGNRDSVIDRELMITHALNKVGLSLRTDSVLCRNFIQYNTGEVDDIVKVMLEMSFLFRYTDYSILMHEAHSRSRRRYRFVDREKIKMIAVREWLDYNAKHLHLVPPTLLTKLENDKGKRFVSRKRKEKAVIDQLEQFEKDDTADELVLKTTFVAMPEFAETYADQLNMEMTENGKRLSFKKRAAREAADD